MRRHSMFLRPLSSIWCAREVLRCFPPHISHTEVWDRSPKVSAPSVRITSLYTRA